MLFSDSQISCDKSIISENIGFRKREGNSSYQYSDIDQIAWHKGNSEGHLHNVGEKQPNEWGLYDMLGNVWE